jgi:cephalosporin hydroxylase
MVPDKCWNDENVKAMGQDTWFYNLVNKCGFKVICDTSVQCLHMELATGKYTAHPDVNLDDYFTIIPITTKLQLADRKRVESDYISRTNIPDYINGIAYPITSLPIKYSEETVNKVISCLRDVQCTQNFYEVSMLCEEIKLLKPKTILEIGVDRGGSMNLWLNFSDPDTSYIGIDNNLQYLMDREHNQSKTFLECDSTDIKTLEQLKEILAGREIDFLFIDGDHKYETVKSDYNMYSPLVRKGGIIALHDIDVSLTNDHEEWVKGIKKFWKELKNTDIKYEEFINTDVDVHFGIGVIFK